MRTPASIAGHPLHPMLIVFPVGLLIFSLICDLISFGVEDIEPWVTVALYCMIGGFIGALIAAIPGFIDFGSLSDRLKKLAMTHMALNILVIVLYAINIGLRTSGYTHDALPLYLSILGVAVLSVSGWLGAEMVHKHGVGVDFSPSE